MIYTCTLNPSLDYYMEDVNDLVVGKLNRSELEYYDAGGKGINVSVVLNNLGIPSRTLGFLGGFTKDFYISLLAKYEYILPNFTYINGNTRINVKLRHKTLATDVNAAGPIITASDMENLANKVKRLDNGDFFVLAGSLQKYLHEDVKKMVLNAISEGVRVCLDTDPKFMREVVENGIFLIKTTPDELGQVMNCELNSDRDVAKCAYELHKLGAKNVMVVKDNKEALLISDEGNYVVSLAREEKTINTVGTGDSLVAGFLMNYLRSKDPVDSFRFAASCGIATAYSKGLATREKIDSFYEKTEIKAVEVAV